MLHNIKEISIKNRRYYFFNDMVNVKSFHLGLLEINKLSCKSANISIYHIGYVAMKSLDHINIDSENPLYLIFNNVDGYIFEGSHDDKYLVYASTNQNKKVIEKYTKL